MRRYYAIFLSVLALCCWQCNDDEDIVTVIEKNWYVVSPSDEPLDNLIYEVFVATGVPIFYNDTIGAEERVDRFGQSWTYYEVLDPNYTIESVLPSVKYILSEEEDELMAGVEFLRDRVLSQLPDEVQPKCFLLVDSLYVRGAGSGITVDQINWVPGGEYRGAGCTVFGCDTLGYLSEGGKDTLANQIIGEEFGAYLRYNYSDSLDAFYRYSNTVAPNGDGQGYNVRVDTYGDVADPQLWYVYGFLSYNRMADYGIWWGETWEDAEDWYYTTPTESQDVADFVAAILTMSEEDFMAEYGEYPVIMNKYEFLKQIVELLVE